MDGPDLCLICSAFPSSAPLPQREVTQIKNFDIHALQLYNQTQAIHISSPSVFSICVVFTNNAISKGQSKAERKPQSKTEKNGDKN